MTTRESIYKCIGVIEDNLYDDITPKKLSQQCFISEFYFHRVFKSVVGLSVMDYMTRRKLSKASMNGLSLGVLHP